MSTTDQVSSTRSDTLRDVQRVASSNALIAAGSAVLVNLPVAVNTPGKPSIRRRFSMLAVTAPLHALLLNLTCWPAARSVATYCEALLDGDR